MTIETEVARKARLKKIAKFLKAINNDLSYAELRGANLSGANLSSANFYCANLVDANFYCANLIDAELRDANFTGADLTDVTWDRAFTRKPVKLAGKETE